MGKIWTVQGLAVERGQDWEFWREKRKETRQKGVKLSQKQSSSRREESSWRERLHTWERIYMWNRDEMWPLKTARKDSGRWFFMTAWHLNSLLIETGKLKGRMKDCIFAPFPAFILAKTHIPPYIRLTVQIMSVLLVQVKELMISLETSCAIFHIYGVTGWGCHVDH